MYLPSYAYAKQCVSSFFVNMAMLRVMQPLYLWWAYRELGTGWLVVLHRIFYALTFDLLFREVRTNKS